MRYALRTCARDMQSNGGFVWPESGHVAAPDWNPAPLCGNGLHMLLWGKGDGRLLDWSPDARWLVVAIADETPVVDLRGKVKVPECVVVHCGDQASATAVIIGLGATGPVVGSTLTGGNRSTLTGGYRSTLAGGDYSKLAGGNYSTLTGGNRSTLTGGYGSKLTGGDNSKLAGGNYSTLTGGHGSTLAGGDYSTLAGGDYSKLAGGNYSTLTGGHGSTLAGGDYSKLIGDNYSTLTGGDYSTLIGGNYSTLTGGDGATMIFRRRPRAPVVAIVGTEGVLPGVKYRLNAASKRVVPA